MELEAYQIFTETLTGNLEGDSRVAGVVALGSMAAQDVQPDRWSDHDFFIIVRPGHQDWFRKNLRWLPEAGEVLYSYQETAHGVKVLYRSGHLLEFAVFDMDELALAKVNRYHILVDTGGLAEKMAALKEATGRWIEYSQDTDETLLGNFLTNLLVGMARFNRGERISGRQFIYCHALGNLLGLLARHTPAEQPSQLDDLDPFRRFEVVHPDLGRLIKMALSRSVPEAAANLLDIARDNLGELFQGLPPGVERVVRQSITKL